MKKLPIKITSLSLLSLALCCGAAAQDQNTPDKKAAPDSAPTASTSAPTTASIPSTEQKASEQSKSNQAAIAAPSATATAPALKMADDEAKDRTDKKLAGHHVRGKDGKDLGRVKDFLINPQSGEVVFAVVSSGGVGSVGDKLRLVPFKALHPGTGTKSDEFSVMLDKTQWEQGVVVKEDELKDGRFTLTDDQRRAFAERFGESTGGAGTSSSYYTAGMSAHLIQASELRGKDVQSGTKEIGSIEGIVIERDGMNSMALFDPKTGVSGRRGKFLVPLNQFSFGTGKREPVSTQLTLAAFEPASSSAPTTAVAASSASSEQKPAEKSTAASSAIAQSSEPRSSSSAQEATAGTQQGSLAAADRASVSTQTTTKEEASPSPTGRASTEQKQQIAMSEQQSATKSESPGSATGEKKEADSERSQSIAANDASTTKSSATSKEQNAQKDEGRDSARIAANSSARSSTDENLTPTGQTSADQNPKDADPALLTSARAIRKSLDEDDSLARLDVKVTPGQGKIMLRGKVADEKLKMSVEEKAKAAAQGALIDNQITVETR
jgi:sporulation protein YlmC with PRC-barrel domain